MTADELKKLKYMAEELRYVIPRLMIDGDGHFWIKENTEVRMYPADLLITLRNANDKLQELITAIQRIEGRKVKK